MIADAVKGEGAGRQYECPECGHANPGVNQFCGMCGAVRDETVTAPSPRTTEPAPMVPAVRSSSGIEHHHHHYHHYHDRINPYLVAAILLLLALISWKAGWDFGLRAAVPPIAATTAASANPHP